jgi:hypothetical protein
LAAQASTMSVPAARRLPSSHRSMQLPDQSTTSIVM